MDAPLMSCSPYRKDTKQHRVKIPMPWKRLAYCINVDGMQRGRPTFFIVWWTEFGAFFMRAGWFYQWDAQQ